MSITRRYVAVVAGALAMSVLPLGVGGAQAQPQKCAGGSHFGLGGGDSDREINDFLNGGAKQTWFVDTVKKKGAGPFIVQGEVGIGVSKPASTARQQAASLTSTAKAALGKAGVKVQSTSSDTYKGQDGVATIHVWEANCTPGPGKTSPTKPPGKPNVNV